MKVVQSCFGTRLGRSMRNVSVSKGRQEGLIWSKDSGQYVFGKFSMSLVQANNLLEDQSQVESCALSTSGSRLFVTLVGIYDGHGGPEASRYINAHFFPNLERLILKHGLISEKVIKKAFQETEDGFFKIVANQWSVNPQLAAVGSCCLVGVVCNGTLYVANAGDSRAVMGRVEKGTGEVEAIQLSEEHNVSIESVRKELQLLHPDDPQIVIKKHGVWRVRGVIQVSRSIGDVYLKDSEYNKEPLYSKFRLRQPFSKPLLSSEPAVTVIKLQPVHRFIIFASDGLWEHFSNQEAVDMVQKHPVNGIAKRLIKAALQNAANKREMRYSDLMKIERGVRRHFHDDISVIVLFLDTNLMSRANSADSFPTPVSIKSVGANLRPNLLAPFSMPIDADT